MRFWENEKYRGLYPEYLTQQEKADIKSALLQKFANSDLPLHHFLENLKTLSDYPER